MKRFTQYLILFVFMTILAACSSMDTAEPMPNITADSIAVPSATAAGTASLNYAAEEEEVMAEPETAVDLQPPNDEAYADMFFEDYGVNPFIDTEDDNLSTFAIDVDTGSYTIMRNYVNLGNLPPDEAVRVEEFINYFEQDYTAPQTGAFAIHLEGSPAPYGENDNYNLVRVGIQGYEVDREQRPDATLIFVIDVSGSMDMDNRLGLVKQSLRILVDELRPTDRVGIVVYGSSAHAVLEPTYVDSRSTILNAIDSVRSEGSTNAEEGLMIAYRMADEYRRSDGITRLILCSDGVANVGNTGAETILQHAADGISLSTFGFGMGNYNDVLMEQLADQGDGSYAYIDTLREAERVFIDDLTGTLLTIAKDAKIQVEFNVDVVERYRLLGYENRDVADEDFRNDTVDAGEIGAGHSVTALYEVKLADEFDPTAAAMTIYVRYADPESGEVTEISNAIAAGQFAASFTEASPRFQLDAVVAEYAEILRDSYWAQENDLSSIVTDAQRIAEYFPGDEDVQEFAQLVSSAATLAR
ncbi:MAG: von Willebrand factor type A domain-containing protein [Anaerolineales bacterium]|nr:von Willebrand factor type A domain-containing protein [Anaerolineales bacterium]